MKQNNAAPPVLTDDEILHRWDAYVSEPSTTYPLTGADKIAFARAIESALLSKLRAPVADERAAGINPDECDAEVYERGTSVGLFAIPKEDANAICAGIAAATGARVDWHYIAGRVHIKALPALASAPVAPAPDGFVPVAASVLRTLAEPGLIKRTLGKFSPALAAKLGFTPEEEKAIEAMYLAFGESFDYPCAPLASAPVADESPMAKAAEALREKARQERQAYQDRREADRVASAPVAGEDDHDAK